MLSIINEYWPSILLFFTVNSIALISPGPDFAIVVRNSLIHSRKVAIATVLGITLGVSVHLVYCTFGLGVVIANNPWAFKLITILGAGYLIYIGYKGVTTKKHKIFIEENNTRPVLTVSAAFKSGFVTNAVNPKAILYFISLFSAFINPQTPSIITAIYASIVLLMTFIWFSFVAICLSNRRLRSKFTSITHIIERVTGGLLIMLGLKLLLF